MTVPALTTPRAARKLRTEQRTLDSGLQVLAVRKPGVPLVELRLRVPFLSARAHHAARAELLAEVLPTGAAGYDRAGFAAAVQGLGADLSVSVDADRLLVSGNVLATNLKAVLALVAALLGDPAYAKAETEIERSRLLDQLTVARSRPGTIAAEALERRMWGEHPYALELPSNDDVAEVTPAQLRSLHRDLVRPSAATLVLVGDLTPAKMADLASTALDNWTGPAKAGRVPALPTPAGSPLLLLDRPGSVQSSVRFARPGLGRTDERWPALQLANLVFGGYFSSRWTENIREDKGYTYGPHSRVDHHVLGSVVGLDVEVATEVTGPALLETWYELGRIASLPVSQHELDSARQYAVGTLSLSTATQAGLASTLSGLAAFGLGPDWLAGHPKRLAGVTVDDVAAAAAEFLAPSGFTSVVVGDADAVAGPLALLGPLDT